MQITKLVLQTSRLQELSQFYKQVLELPVLLTDSGHMEVKIGESMLVFQSVANSKPFYHFAFTIPANKIGEAHQWLRTRVELLWIDDYQSEIADFTNWNARSVYFLDPAGNIVELIARDDLSNPATAAFSSKQILSVSEAGLVLDPEKFDDHVNQLLTQYQLSYFSKQAALPSFRAVGDEQGLFVIVPAARNWYPTTTPAAIFPMEIYFTQQQTDREEMWTCGNVEV